MTTPAISTNRAERRKTGSTTTSRRKPVIAGSLLTVGGIFGAYLGYVRPPAAFASVTCPVGSTTFNGTDGSSGLQAAITAAGDAGIVCITNDFTLDADVLITTSVTLIGRDSATYPIIDGTGTFDIGVDLDGPGASVTVKYLKLHNLGHALALCGETGDTLTVSNSTISDSALYALRVQPGSNGPVTCTGSAASILVQDSTISGGISQIRQVGTGDFTCSRTTVSDITGSLYIKSDGALSLDNCDLINTGSNGSPALVISETAYDPQNIVGTVSISNSDFTDNANGAIEILGARQISSLTISGSTFSGNGPGTNHKATVGVFDAPRLTTFTISNSSFTNNTPGAGGTLHVYDSGAALYIKDTQFTGNIANSGNSVGPTGAALYSYGNLKMRNVDFTGNKTSGSGTFPAASAIGISRSSGPTMDWDDVVVTGNGDASIDLPAVYIGSGYGTITNSRFSDNLSGGAVKDLRIALNVNDYLPLTSITSTSVSSRSTVSIAPGSVTTVSLTYLDEVPSGGGDSGGSSGGSAGTTESANNTATTPAMTAPPSGPTVTLVPVTFSDASKVVPSQIESLTPAQVASIPYAQFKDLSPNVFAVLTAAQVAALPLDLTRAIRPARLAAIKPAAIAGMSGAQLSTLRLASVRAMSPQQVAAIGNETIKSVAPIFMAQLKPKVLAAMDPAVIAALSPEQAAAIRPAALARLSIQSLRLLDENTFAALSVRQLGKLTPRQVAQLTDKQRAALTATQRRALRRG